MARPCCIDADLVGKAKEIVAEARDLETLRSAQAVLLPALLGATLEQTAVLLGIGRATVNRLQRDLRCRCAESVKPVVAHGATPRADDARRRTRISVAVGKVCQRGGSAGGCLRGVSDAGATRLAQGGTRYTASEERFAGAGKLEKNGPKTGQPSPNQRMSKDDECDGCSRTRRASDAGCAFESAGLAPRIARS